MSEIATQSAHGWQALRLVWSAAPRWTATWVFLLILVGFLPAVAVYLSRSLIDGLVAAAGAGWSWVNIWPVAFPGGLIAAVLALQEIARGVSGWVRAAQAELMRDHLSAIIHEKSSAVDLAFYESAEYHDKLERARGDLSSRPLALLENLGSLLQNSITLMAMAALLVPYGLWLPCLLVVSTAPGFYVVVKFNRRYHSWWEATTSDRRRTQYYDTLLTNSAVAPELRLFDLGAYFALAYQTLRSRMRNERLQLTKDQAFARLAAGMAGILISSLGVAWMLWRVVQGLATLGDLALFYQAFQRGLGLLRTLLENLGQVYANTLFLGNLFEFLNLPPRVVDPPRAVAAPPLLREAIRFEHVTFRYPGAERPVLRDFSLTVPAGQIAAIVGANGAGKSTLLKLLCRFYDPESGVVALEGTNIRDLLLKDLRRMATVLFQWPVPYQATAADNIAFGDLSSANFAAVLEAATRAAGAHDVIAGLPNGYDTLLGKWFANGVELSIGEWQRLALARAFFRRAPILILDEPTSALDSWAEADWFDRFRSLAAGRTAIIITHRFTIARRADVIHVMEAGRIVESGNHDGLLAQGGLYARSWMTQVHGATPTETQLSPIDTDLPLNGAKVKT